MPSTKPEFHPHQTPLESLDALQSFANMHSLKTIRDKGDDSRIIKGRFGHLYEYDDCRLAVIYLSDSVGKANNRRRACEKAGMEITQNGDTEFAAAFDPSDRKQAALAIQVAGVKTRFVMSDVQKANLAAARARSPLSQNTSLPVTDRTLGA